METLYTLSSFLIVLVVILGLAGVIKPSLLKRALRQHASRKKIFVGSLASLVILSGIVGATEPQYVKDARLAKEQAASAAQKYKDKKPSEQKSVKNKIETKTITETETIAFTEEKRNDSTLANGQTKVVQQGKNGEKTLTYKVTYSNGKETKRQLINDAVTMEPINKITAVGTYIATKPKTSTPPATSGGSCNPNYSGCVPIASDVDCAGGEGDGPAYLTGTAKVIGTDVYKLDRDKNGIACD